MDAQHKQIIENTIDDAYSDIKKILNFERDSKFQLLLSQLNLFKTLSALIIGLISMGYFYNHDLDTIFIVVAFIFSIFNLFLLISYIRETVDDHEKLVEQDCAICLEFNNDRIKNGTKALLENDENILYSYAKDEREKLYNEDKKLSPNYIGEVVVFLFYLTIGFLILSFFAKIYHISFISLHTALVMFLSYILSYKNWAIKFSKIASEQIF